MYSNWYKIAKTYLDIGHDRDFSHVLWYSPDGIQIIKSPKSKRLDHWSWYKKKGIPIGQYSGRYDVNTRELSVVDRGYAEVSSGLINNLIAEFPEAKTLHVFHSFGGDSEVIRLASNRIAKDYIDIGHKNPHVLWFSVDGMDIRKSPPDVLDHSRWKEYTRYSKSPTYDGRYDPVTKEVSVICPEFRPASESLLNNLIRAFPDVRTIYVFDSYNSHETFSVREGILLGN